MFDASPLRCYFDLHKIQYEKKSIDANHEICDYFEPDTREYSSLINICDKPKLNLIGSEKETYLSKSWYGSRVNKDRVKIVKRNTANYFKNIVRAKSDSVMWTVFKDWKEKLKGEGYTKGFVPCNYRATNKYRETYNLAFLNNTYLNPEIKNFFLKRKVAFDDGQYALSELLQWIWRSRIRDGQPINLYLPSVRMRNLLTDWLSGKDRAFPSRVLEDPTF